ncbi:MAG: Ig-like domain-containing protein [Bacteroidota bacterium]
MTKEKRSCVIPSTFASLSVNSARNLVEALGNRIFLTHAGGFFIRLRRIQNDIDLTACRFIIVTFSVFLLLLSGCAGQRPPEGGPVDTEPPQIISVYPTPQTTNFTDNKIVLEFSEYVDRRSVEEAIFISPNISETEFDWSGTEVELIFHEELRKNTTYVITVGTDVRDVRASNRMASAFSLSFSTGDKIDNGMITGKVFDEKPDGVMIFSYRLNDINADTLDPKKSKPDYVTQTGKEGEFRLTNIAQGTYRLFAVRDEFRNLLYDPETDAVGTTEDVTLTDSDTVKAGVKFIVTKEDTTAPRIVSAQPTDDSHLTVQFSEPIDTATMRASSFAITDTLGRTQINVLDLFPVNFQLTAFTLVTDQQRGDSLYLLQVEESVRDNTGYGMSPLARNKMFTGSGVKDTVPASILFLSVKDSSSKIFSDDRIVMRFSDVIDRSRADSMIRVMRNKDSSSVPVILTWMNRAAVSIKSAKPFTINESYSLSIVWNYIVDPSGNVRKDSITTVQFSIDDPENYGSIEGNFAGFGSETSVIQAENIVDKKQTQRKVKTSASGKFVFNRLPEGRYVLKAFDDRNNNFIHDAGKPFPFLRAEPFSIYTDTVRVRPRWPVDGVMFREK